MNHQVSPSMNILLPRRDMRDQSPSRAVRSQDPMLYFDNLRINGPDGRINDFHVRPTVSRRPPIIAVGLSRTGQWVGENVDSNFRNMKRMRVGRSRSVGPSLAIISVAFVLAACSTAAPRSLDASRTQTPPEQSQPIGINTTFQWLPTPDFDLMSPEGLFVRAYVESYEHARNGQDTTWGYPGFAAASPPDIDSVLANDDLGLRFTGTFFYRLLHRKYEVSSMKITLCRYGYATFPEGNGSTFDDWPPRPVLLNVNTTGAQPPAHQRGPRRAPVTNVFGDWKVTEIDFVPTDPHIGKTPDYSLCAATLSGIPPLPTEPAQRSEPVPPLPPSPGWPDASL